MAKALIFGAGGVGCIYGYLLDQGGADVTAVCRSNYDQVKEHGIVIRSKKWGTCLARPTAVRTIDEAAQQGPYDFILVCTKAFPGTAEIIRPAVGPGTAIVLAQNGIGIEQDYATAYPHNTLISGVVYLPTTQVEPGIIEHGTPLERFEIGTFPTAANPHNSTSAVQRLADLFKTGGGTCVPSLDIQAQRWTKLALNAAFNPLTALTLCDDANFLRSSPYALATAKDIMREVGELAAACGCAVIDESVIEAHMRRHMERLETGGKEPSMLVDVRCGRSVEVEAILGNAVRLAEGKGVGVPGLRMLYTLTKARDFAVVKGGEWRPIARVS